MHIVIIIALVILLFVIPWILNALNELVKQLFGNPCLNSKISIILDGVILALIGCSLVIRQTFNTAILVLIIVYLLAIVDCIRDL